MASIDAFLAQQQQQQPATALLDKASDTHAPQPHTYEFQSGSVVEMLEGLLDKFDDQRVELEKQESSVWQRRWQHPRRSRIRRPSSRRSSPGARQR